MGITKEDIATILLVAVATILIKKFQTNSTVAQLFV